MKIAIVGAAGRMGQKLCELAKGTELEVVSKVDVAEGYDKTWAAGVEGVIDFSYHTGVPASIAKAASEGIPYVIGTTGITAEEQKSVDAAAKVIPVVQSGNYSLGVNLLMELVKKAATILGPEYDVEVTEMHHKHKKDAPSGTALMMAKSAAEGRGVTLDDKAVYGRHGDLERVEITHKAQDRAAFAAGALQALKWAKGKPAGIYTMRHVLGFD